MLKKYLEKVARGNSLNDLEAYQVMALFCSGNESLAQAAALLAILHTRGETIEELLGFLTYLRQQSIAVDGGEIPVIDTCGTGGDYANTFNISTAAALLLASSGIKVAKHGGRSVSSACGSANVMQALGIPMQTEPQLAQAELARHGLVFLFAPAFNKAYQAIAALRKELSIRTCFNLLGPLLNPAAVKRQVIGVYDERLLLPIAELLRRSGTHEALVVHSHDGLDEIALSAATDIVHLKQGRINSYTITPEDLGLPRAAISHIQGKDAAANALIIQQIFAGKLGPQRDVVLANAAAGFVVAGKTASLKQGVIFAAAAIDSGQAERYLQQITLTDQE